MANPNISITQKDLAGAKDTVCEQCQHNTFKNEFIIKTVSALLSPTGKEINVPIPIFACAKCGHINKSFFPEI